MRASDYSGVGQLTKCRSRDTRARDMRDDAGRGMIGSESTDQQTTREGNEVRFQALSILWVSPLRVSFGDARFPLRRGVIRERGCSCAIEI